MLDRLEKWWEKTFVRIAVYLAFAALTFLVFLLWTFPDQRVAQIAEQELDKAFDHQYDVSVGSVGLWRLTGARAQEVRLQERIVGGDDEEEGAVATTISLDGISVRVSPIRSMLNRAVTARYSVDIGGDSIDGTVKYRGNDLSVHVDFDEVDLRDSTLLASFLGVPLFGVLDGHIDVDFDLSRGGVLTSGEVDLRGEQLTLEATQIEHEQFPVTLDLPTTSFGTLNMDIDIEETQRGSRVNIDRFITEGGRDIQTEAWGHIEVGPRGTQPRVDLRLQVSDRYVTEHDLGPVFNIQEFRDGAYQNWYGFVISGRGGDINFRGSRTAAQGPDADGEAPPPQEDDEALPADDEIPQDDQEPRE